MGWVKTYRRAEEPTAKKPEHQTPTPMNNLLNIIIVLLIVGWLVGYIGFSTAVGSLIHLLLVIAVIVILYRVITGRKPLN